MTERTDQQLPTDEIRRELATLRNFLRDEQRDNPGKTTASQKAVLERISVLLAELNRRGESQREWNKP